MNEVLELFRREVDGLVGDVRAAVELRDAMAIKRTAHRLKGALVSLGARPSVEAARALEISGGSRELVDADESMAQLDYELRRLLQAITLPSAA